MGQKPQRMAFSHRLTAGADLQLLIQVFQVGFDGFGAMHSWAAMVRRLWLRPIFDDDSWNLFEIAPIPRHQHHIVDQRRGSDTKIPAPNTYPRGTQFLKFLLTSQVERKDGYTAEKLDGFHEFGVSSNLGFTCRAARQNGQASAQHFFNGDDTDSDGIGWNGGQLGA